MPLKIVPPRHARTSHLYIRGSYLGVKSGQEQRN